jgi:hypothetical protein
MLSVEQNKENVQNNNRNTVLKHCTDQHQQEEEDLHFQFEHPQHPSPQPLMFLMEGGDGVGHESVHYEISKLPIPPPKSKAFAAQEYITPIPLPSTITTIPHYSPMEDPGLATSPSYSPTATATPDSCASDPADSWDFLMPHEYNTLYGVTGKFIGKGTYGSVYAVHDLQSGE